MATGLDRLKHIVVLMMENRSFDHMLGSLKAVNPKIDGLDRAEPIRTQRAQNPVPGAAAGRVSGTARSRSRPSFSCSRSADLRRRHEPDRTANMQGFVKSYFNQRRDVKHSQKIMYYFTQEAVACTDDAGFGVRRLQPLVRIDPRARRSATARSRTTELRSAGSIMNPLYSNEPFKSIYKRLIDAPEAHLQALLLRHHQFDHGGHRTCCRTSRELFGTYPQFLRTASAANLPDYSFVEPNYSDHDTDSGEEIANDQHPDHHVQAGELFIATIYNAIKQNPELWESTALLIVYDEHGGIYDHVRAARLHRRTNSPHPQMPPEPACSSSSTGWACACPQSWSRPGFPRGRSWTARIRPRVDSGDRHQVFHWGLRAALSARNQCRCLHRAERAAR